MDAQPERIPDDEALSLPEPRQLSLPPDLAELKLLVTCYYSIQEHRIKVGNRVWALETRLGVAHERAERLHWRLMGGTYEGVREKGLLDVEAAIAKDILAIVREQPLWRSWLVDVKGIGPILAGGWIAGVGDISRFDTVSKLWAYCGLHTLENTPERAEAAYQARVRKATLDAKQAGKAPTIPPRPEHLPERIGARRERGQVANWSPFLRVLAWKTGESFVKTKGGYREQYDRQREKYQRTRPDTSDGHRHAMAKRATVKLFLSHLWEEWRRLEDVPIRPPYPVEYLGHTTTIPVIRR